MGWAARAASAAVAPEAPEAHEAAIYDMVFTSLNVQLLPALQDPSSNLGTGRQLRGARLRASLTRRKLGAALGVDERHIRVRERRHHSKPTGSRHHTHIERALLPAAQTRQAYRKALGLQTTPMSSSCAGKT